MGFHTDLKDFKDCYAARGYAVTICRGSPCKVSPYV